LHASYKFTNRSTARRQPFAAAAADSAAPKGNFRDHNRLQHTARAARLDSAVAVVVGGSAAASIAAAAVVVAALAQEVLVEADSAAVPDFAMRRKVERVVKVDFAETERDCTSRAKVVDVVVVVEMAEQQNSVHAAREAATIALHCSRHSRSWHSLRQIR
jgi:hypothetical protein